MRIIEILVAVVASLILFGSGLLMGLVIARGFIEERRNREYEYYSPIPADWWIK